MLCCSHPTHCWQIELSRSHQVIYTLRAKAPYSPRPVSSCRLILSFLGHLERSLRHNAPKWETHRDYKSFCCLDYLSFFNQVGICCVCVYVGSWMMMCDSLYWREEKYTKQIVWLRLFMHTWRGAMRLFWLIIISRQWCSWGNCKISISFFLSGACFKSILSDEEVRNLSHVIFVLIHASE